MYTKNQIRDLVQENIHQIKISEFVSEGGWPNIDNVDVQVLNQSKNQISLVILYTVDKAGCCFIPGGEQQMRLHKTLLMSNHKIKFKADE